MTMSSMPVLSIYRVTTGGDVSLAAANVPYGSLQWTRRFSTCGEFSAQLSCPFPLEWPGRYLVSIESDEVGVLEKIDAHEGAKEEPPTLYGRFAESFFDRYKFSSSGATARGANWRQAVTAGMRSWHMDDLPAISMGSGTASSTGSSYKLTGDAGDSGMEALYGAANTNSARIMLTLDHAGNRLVASIVDGVDRTRAQSSRPVALFSLAMGTAVDVYYCGDYSVGCSEVIAHAERSTGDEDVSITRTVKVSGFDAATQWKQRAYEDVTSFFDVDTVPTAALVDEKGRLRAYEHTPALAIDLDAGGQGYRELWDLGDLVEVEMPSLSLTAQERIEEVREVYEPSGAKADVTVGTKQLTKLARALIGRS